MYWATYWALKNLFPSKKRLTFFTVIATIGVALGVAVLVVVESVMNGFQSDIRERLVEAQGEIRIEGYPPIEHIEKLEQELKSFSEVKEVVPYAWGMVMLIRDEYIAFACAKGVTEEESKVTGILRNVETDRGNFWEKLEGDGIILGENLANRLQVGIGDKVEVYAPQSFEALSSNEIIFPKSLVVVDILSGNNYTGDVAISSLSCMQELYNLEERVSGVTIKLQDTRLIEGITEKLQQSLGERYQVTDWIHSNSDLLFALRWEKTMMFLVLLFILLVSSFSIASMLITNVVRRTREIGVIVALGGSSRLIAWSFCLQGIIIGGLGLILGTGLGVTVLHYRDTLIAHLYRWFTMGGVQNYLSQFAHLPVEYQAIDFGVIGVFTFAICFLSGIIPAYKALKIDPARALHLEQ